MKTLLIIPAYNEAENIENVITKLAENFPQYDYVIVNDGSKDETEAICKRNGFNYVSHAVNLGLAGAFRTGMKYALEYDYDAAIQFDGDGQHNPEYIADMLKEVENGNDIVIGSRFVTKKKPFSMRMLGNDLIGLAVRLTTGKKIKDTTSGMRLYNRRMIRVLAHSTDFAPEPDTVAFFVRKGARVKEIQVEMNERTAGQSYLTFTKSVSYMARMLTSILLLQWFRKGEL